jgi:O-antigen/teichoic acid export membrane protein
MSDPSRDAAVLEAAPSPGSTTAVLPDTDAPGADLSGRDRIAWNVLTGWVGYAIEVAAGFIVPRLIDQQVGQTALGLWDFGWSCIAYLRLAQIGVAPATSRYLARYRAVRDTEGLRRVASSTFGVSIAVATLVLTLTGLAVVATPWLLPERLGDQVRTAQLVIAALGVGLAFDYLCEVFSGILTGSHRWDLHNAMNAAANLFSAVAMIATLFLGGGLPAVALAYTAGSVASELLRMFVAFRVCPELQLRPGHFSLDQARQLLHFGVKASVSSIAGLVLVQTNNLIIVGHLGPAALALYARPNALLRIPDNLVRKIGFVLAPTASSLQGAGRHAEIRKLVLDGTRASAAITIPLMLGLAILGGPLLLLWMGPRYEQGLVLTVLALGTLPSLTQRPVASVLMGLNLHGFVARMNVWAAVLGIGLSVLNVNVLGLGLVGAAAAVVGPTAVTTGFLIPAYVCRHLEIRLRDFVRDGLLTPLLCALPFALVLAVSRLAFGGRPLIALTCGAGAGAAVLAPLYWRLLLSPGQRRAMVGRLAGIFAPA